MSTKPIAKNASIMGTSLAIEVVDLFTLKNRIGYQSKVRKYVRRLCGTVVSNDCKIVSLGLHLQYMVPFSSPLYEKIVLFCGDFCRICIIVCP